MFRPPLISIFLTSTALATTWTVDDDGKADFDNIQAAVDAASDGDEIIVMPGTYTSTAGEVIDMQGKEIWLHSSGGAEVTIIDGEETRRGIYCDNDETSKTIIKGFTITNGYSTEYGGGMYNYNSSPTLKSCTFTNNTANWGGGMYNYSSSPTLENCTFTNNTANYGGGMFNENTSPTLTNCTFTNNTANYGGGGLCNYDNGSTTLTNCTFENNTAPSGGGMYNEVSSPTLTDCTFTGNTASYVGGGMCNYYSSSPTLTNCTFTGNTAASDTYGGGGMYNDSGSTTLDGCTFTNNTSSNIGGGIYNYGSDLTLTDSRFCGNTPTHIHGVWNDLGWNLFWDVCNDCNGNGIDDFQDILDGTSLDCDNDLTPDECQYDCDDDGVPDPTELYCYQTQDDIDDDGHPDDCQTDCDSDGIPDSYAIELGIVFDCDENGIPDNCETDCNENGLLDWCDINDGTSEDSNDDGIPDECQCLADINGDGQVDVEDLLLIISQWNLSGGSADINFDGIVDVSDLLIVIGNWGACLPSGCLGNGLVDSYTATVYSPCRGILESGISLSLALNSSCSVTGTANVYGETYPVTTTTWSHANGILTIGSFSTAVAESATTFTTPLEQIFPAVAATVLAIFDGFPLKVRLEIIANCGSPEAWVSGLQMTWIR